MESSSTAVAFWHFGISQTGNGDVGKAGSGRVKSREAAEQLSSGWLLSTAGAVVRIFQTGFSP